jgi:hypothetical protein
MEFEMAGELKREVAEAAGNRGRRKFGNARIERAESFTNCALIVRSDSFRMRRPPAASQIATAKPSVNAGRHRRAYRQEPGHQEALAVRMKEARP